jgi:twitching motility two-component system response regulator PilH
MDKLALRDRLARMIAHKGEPVPVETGVAKDAAVLIVDDSRTIVRAIQLMLEREGYLTFSAFDGEQAVSLTRKHKPDAILMDIVMPVMNGFEATRILTNDAATAGIPIIVVSGSEQPADRAWGMRLGAKGFLAKPINKDELLARVRSVIAVARRAQTAEPAHANLATDTLTR